MAGKHEIQPIQSDSLPDAECGEAVLRKDMRQPSNTGPIVMIDMVQYAIHVLGEDTSEHERREAVMKAIGDAYDLLSEENKQRIHEHAELEQHYLERMKRSS